MGQKLMAELKQYRLTLGFVSVGFLALGILFAVMRADALIKIMMIFGIVVAASGAVMLLTYFLRDKKNNSSTTLNRWSGGVLGLCEGVVLVVIGAVILVNPSAFAGLFPLFLGIYLILMGAVALLLGWSMNLAGEPGAKGMLIFGGVLAVLGLVMAFNPFRTLSWIALLLGIGMIVGGVVGLVLVVFVSFESKRILRLDQKDSIPAEYRDLDKK